MELRSVLLVVQVNLRVMLPELVTVMATLKMDDAIICLKHVI